MALEPAPRSKAKNYEPLPPIGGRGEPITPALRTLKHQESYERVDLFTLDEVLSRVGGPGSYGHHWEVLPGFRVKLGSLRYKVFKANQICVGCGMRGKYFALERQSNHKDLDKVPWHFNLYGVNGQGVEVLFTKDHTLPKCLGGSNALTNLETMCYTCNQEKGGRAPIKMPTKEQFKGYGQNHQQMTCSLEVLPDSFLYDFQWEIKFYKSMPKKKRKVLVRKALGLDPKQAKTYLLRDGWASVLRWVRDNTCCHPRGWNCADGQNPV